MKNIVYTVLAATLLINLVSCGGEEKLITSDVAAVPVKMAIAKSSNNTGFVDASGQIEAKNSANLSTRMMGFVTELHVKMSSPVRKGDLLLSINNTDLQAKKAQVEASIIQATAAFQNAKKDHERFISLYEQGSASQKELDDMTTRFQMAEAGLNAAEHLKSEVEAQFSYAKIRAPFSGIITNTFVKEGDMANPGMPLISIQSSGDQQVSAMVSEANINAIKMGMEVEVIVKSLNKMLKGKVSEVSRSAKNTGGQYLVKVDLIERNESVLSGMFVNVKFPTGMEKSADSGSRILVPKTSLVKHGQLTGIYTIGSEETAILRWLRIGKIIDDQVEVLSGLAANESFILAAEGRLYNGAKVSIN